MVCGARDAATTSEVPCEKNAVLKSMQLNVLKMVTRMTKRGGAIRTDLIGRQCLDELGT